MDEGPAEERVVFWVVVLGGRDESQENDYLKQTLEAAFWENGQALGFPIKFKLVLKHLRQDMRDDWYFDCLQYDDLFKNPEDAKRIILSLLQEWNGAYSGTHRVVRNIPKKGCGERYSLETDFFDRFVYQAICSFLMPYYDRLLSHRVLSYRFNPAPKNPKYLFKNKIDRWFTFEGVTLTFARSNQYLLVTDISNFYENISRVQLIDALESVIPDVEATGPEKLHIRNAIRTLNRLLEQWTFNGDQGLPQNRDASSFLSNILLSSVDRSMAEKGYDYYRYVDDIRVLTDTEAKARRALQALIRELRNVGLNINASKTVILSPDISKDELVTYFPCGDSNTTAINRMWQSKSRRVVIQSVPYIFNILIGCIERGDTQARQFRFAVNRVATIVASGLFSVGDSLSDRLLDTLSRSLSEHAASTEQYCRLLDTLDSNGRCFPALEVFLLDEESAIHDWQNYNIWLLLGKRRYRSEKLLALAARKIDQDITSGEAAAILIWLRCVGETGLLRKCLDKFSELPFQNARYLLIASSQLPKAELKPLYGQVPTRLKRTGQRAERYTNDEGLPFAERERADILSLVDEVSEYD